MIFRDKDYFFSFLREINHCLTLKKLPDEKIDMYRYRSSADEVFRMLSFNQKKVVNDLFHAVEHNYINHVIVGFFLCEMYLSYGTAWYYDQSYKDIVADLSNLTKQYTYDNYIKMQTILTNSSQQIGVELSQLYRVNMNGTSFIYDLYRADGIDLVMLYRTFEYMGDSTNEKYSELKKVLRIMREIEEPKNILVFRS